MEVGGNYSEFYGLLFDDAPCHAIKIWCFMVMASKEVNGIDGDLYGRNVRGFYGVKNIIARIT